MTIRLVALDLDRTLMGFDGKVSEANRRAVKWALSRGVVVTLATSRRFPSAARFAADLGIEAPLITFGGAYVAEPDRSRVYVDKGLGRGLAGGVLGFVRDNGYPAMAYTVDDLLATDRAVLDSGFWRQEDVQYWTPVRGVDDSLVQVVVVGEGAVREVGRFLDEEFAGEFRYDLFTQQTVPTGHLLNPAVGKGVALAELAARLGIEQSEVMAIGDEHADAGMVEWAGTGIAMSWAIPEVLAVADEVTREDDPDGVATMLYRHLG